MNTIASYLFINMPSEKIKRRGAKIFGVFRVKNHDFTPKNHIFSNFRGGRAPGAPRPW
jgi:hypothetical protein